METNNSEVDKKYLNYQVARLHEQIDAVEKIFESAQNKCKKIREDLIEYDLPTTKIEIEKLQRCIIFLQNTDLNLMLDIATSLSNLAKIDNMGAHKLT